MDETPKKSKRKKILSVLFAGTLLGIGIFFGVKALFEYRENVKSKEAWDSIHHVAFPDEDLSSSGNDSSSYEILDNDEYEDIYDEKDDSSSSDSNSSRDENDIDDAEYMQKRPDFAALSDINSDIESWVYVPGTYIDYPVLKEHTYNQYAYLYKNMYGWYSDHGSVFKAALPDDNSESSNAHDIIYGHNMQDGTMFGSMLYYRSYDFYEEHPYVYIYYPDRTERWLIWTVAHIGDNDPVYSLSYKRGSDEYNDMLTNHYNSRMYDTNVSKTVNKYTKTLTLSTCDWVYGNHSGRFALTCVRDKVLLWK